MDRKPKKNDGEAASWIVTLIMLSVFWPLGLVCLFSKLGRNDFIKELVLKIKNSILEQLSKGSGDDRNAQNDLRMKYNNVSTVFSARENAAPKKSKKTPDKVSKGRLWLLPIGWILLASGIFFIFEPIFSHSLWRTLQWAAVSVGGLGMLFAAGGLKKREQEYSECISYVGEKAYVDLSKMMTALGLKRRELMHNLEDMISRGYLGDSAYIDRHRDILVIAPSRLDPEMRDETVAANDASDDAGRDKYDLLLAEIRRASVRIQDSVMTEKTNQIERLTASIFSAVKDSPEKLQKISSFLNYYLPTTLKLLNLYADFEQQGFQGDNMSKSKERIENVTDTLIAAYTKQLDSLFLSDSIDVESDIDVLETMMKRDGLSEGDFGTASTGTS